MNLAKDKISRLYFSYLGAAFGSALITSIFGVVDHAMVGQYYGPSGSAALGVVAPFWNILYGTGLLVGVGGSVLYSISRGAGDKEKANRIFSASVFLGLLLSGFLWGFIWILEDKLLSLFGADPSFIAICQDYLFFVKLFVPVFLFTQIIAAFLRNDSAPGWATISVLTGGIFNIFGDWFFVFGLNMGAKGAGLATAAGAVISLLMMGIHFLKKSNTLKLSIRLSEARRFPDIIKTGTNTFITDVCMGFLTILFNNQIMRFLGTDALAVYSVIVNISTFATCTGYGVGQAAQPIFSFNYGAKLYKRILKLLNLCLLSCLVLAVIWTGLAQFCSLDFVRIFMAPQGSVLEIAPAIFAVYGLSFLLLPYNVFMTFFFQALHDNRTATILSLLRGALISGALILLLPSLFGSDSLWWAMPAAELICGFYATAKLFKTIHKLRSKER